MHSKIFHRLLGLFLLFAIVLLMLPFWDGEDELSINERVVHPPIFPDQPIHESSEAIPKPKTEKIDEKKEANAVFPKTDLETVFAEEWREVKLSEANTKLKIKTRALEPIKKMASSKIKLSSPGSASLTWSVQVEGFKNKSDALMFVNRLPVQKVNLAYLQTMTYANSTRAEVWIGPVGDYRQAEQLSARLRSRYGFQFYIMRHDGMQF